VVAVAVMLGAVMGSLNGLLIVWGGIPSIIVTLGTMAIYRGLLVELSGAKTVTTASLPDWIVDLPHVIVFRVLGIDLRVMVALALLLVVIAHFAVTSLNAGRRFYAVGSNPDAAALIGLPIKRIIFSAFLLSGALSGLAGFMTLSRFGDITVEAGLGLELQVVAAVVVGGVNIFGGSGTVIGAMLGAILIGTLEQSLFRLQISQFWLDALLGLLILLAVTSDSIILRRLRAVWAR
jgi:rhamnose transport system permease protein